MNWIFFSALSLSPARSLLLRRCPAIVVRERHWAGVNYQEQRSNWIVPASCSARRKPPSNEQRKIIRIIVIIFLFYSFFFWGYFWPNNIRIQFIFGYIPRATGRVNKHIAFFLFSVRIDGCLSCHGRRHYHVCVCLCVCAFVCVGLSVHAVVCVCNVYWGIITVINNK